MMKVSEAISTTVLLVFGSFNQLAAGFGAPILTTKSRGFGRALKSAPSTRADIETMTATPTELPDSLDDSAELAAKSCIDFVSIVFDNVNARCRVDFDTSMGDETYTTLKSSTEFMQKFTTALCYGMVDGLQQYRQDQMMKVATAKAELRTLMSNMDVESKEEESLKDDENSDSDTEPDKSRTEKSKLEKIEELKEIVLSGGGGEPWKGDKVRIYFPDEGNAALARRDWKVGGPDALVPPCVEFSSLGGVQTADTSRDVIVMYFCPRAAECQYLEETLYKYEESGKIKLSVLVNPLLVDMGVTGFGMAGRRLRERLLDGLQNTYYLRTLQWGALTRAWPRDFTVWQEDSNSEDGYRMIRQLERLPSNPEVEDIYDVENGLQSGPTQGPGFLNALGDFVQGMTRL